LRVYDPHLGWRAKPGVVLYRSLDRPVRFAANRQGFRDREHSPIKTISERTGHRRIRKIMIFGDSFTESAQVELYETFWSILKHRLNSSQSEVYWEVQTFGVGDWGTTQQWLAYRKYGRLADLAILQVFPLNDIANNSIGAAHLASSQDAFRPYLDPRTNYDSITYLNPKTSWLRQRSHLARYLISLAISRRGAWGREESFRNAQERIEYSNRRSQELGMPPGHPYPAVLYNTFAYRNEQLEPFAQGWDATDRAITRFANAARKRRDKAMVVVIPHIGQLQPMARNLEDLPFTVHTDYAERRISSLLEGRDVPVVGLLDLFQQHIDTVAPYLAGHLNRETHHLVAEALEPEVLKLFEPDDLHGPPRPEGFEDRPAAPIPGTSVARTPDATSGSPRSPEAGPEGPGARQGQEAGAPAEAVSARTPSPAAPSAGLGH
ncbi:MAG: hypothetical protein AAFX50_08970, partial [Acidobacteriota bacterium]